MHEMAICQALLQQLERVAADHDAQSVRRATVRVGPLSGVDPQLLKRAFSFARGAGIAASAELTVQLSPISVECRDCGARTPASIKRLTCGACRSYRIRVVEGDELLLSQVELEHLETPAEAYHHV